MQAKSDDTITAGGTCMSRQDRGECAGGEDCSEELHLCKISKRGDLEKMRELVKDACYLCRKCGRSAHDTRNLCRPVVI
jgi:hypothetical protein